MDQIKPLFPLKLVVFPESKYPLHIFERRYKNMIKYCMETNKGFGIVAKVGKEVSNIGCYVKIDTVLKHYDNDEFDIIVEGQNRFLISKIDVHEKGYFIADVKEYNDKESGTDPGLLFEIRNRFEEVLKKVNLELDEAFWSNFINSKTKSYKIAEKSGLTVSEQQELLLIQDENTRLRFLKEHFDKLNDQLASNIADKMFIMNDGYLN